MFNKFILAIITIIMLVSSAGCGTGKQSNPASGDNDSQGSSSGTVTETIPTQYNQMLPFLSGSVAELKLDATADGTTQQLKVGQVMSISLESNPSTGYSWFAISSDSAVILEMGEPEYQQPISSTTPIVGAPETETLFFQAVKAGTATLTFEYKRGWGQNVEPEKTITIMVEVK